MKFIDRVKGLYSDFVETRREGSPFNITWVRIDASMDLKKEAIAMAYVLVAIDKVIDKWEQSSPDICKELRKAMSVVEE